MRNVCIALLGFVMAFTAACTAPPKKEEPPEMYWPTPPEVPRVKFLDYIIGSLDATGERKGKFKEILFGSASETTFAKPSYVKVRNEVMYVNDVNRVQVYDFKNRKFFTIHTEYFHSLSGIGLNDDGTVYVGDAWQRKIFGVTSDLKRMFQFEQPPEGFSTVGGIAVDHERDLVYAADTRRHRVVVFDTLGKYIKSIGSRGVEPGRFNFPYDVAVDNEGNLAVLDSGNFRVQVFSADGEVISIFGKVGTAPGSFARPRGIAFDNDGHIYVVDAAFANFQIFDYQGNTYLFVGKGGAAPGQFSLPMGIYIDDKDKIYVVDQYNKRVQIFQYLKHSEEKDLSIPVPEPAPLLYE